MVNFSVFLIVIVFSANLGLAKEKSQSRRHKKSHTHGSGKMNLAVDGNSLFVELEMPSHDVVGFEYLPSKPEEQTKVAQAIKILSQESLVFNTPSDARCTIQGKPKVESELDVKNKVGKKKKNHHDHGHNHSHEKKSEVSQSEFKAIYTFTCKRIISLDFILFKKLKALKRIKTQVITNEKQFSQVLTPKSYKIVLGK